MKHSSSTSPIPENGRAADPAPSTARGGFDGLGLSSGLQQAVARTGYDRPTPIQAKAIPIVLEGKDVLGCAQTGTGKTAAFALPIIERLAATPRGGKRVVRALVLAPTRELASQIADSFERYGRGSGITTAVVFGGVGKRPQVDTLRRGVDVLVACPGRLLDLMNDRAVSLSGVEHFVLDEADRMLDMGFIHDVRRIIRAIPVERQTLLFSATMPREIRDLADRTLRSPVSIAVDPVASTCEPITQSVYFVDARQKVDLLINLLQDQSIDRALVFTRTKHGANKVAQKLERARVAAAAIHGNKSQSARERALEGFKRGETRVVVATDIAARGIDVKDLSHVINFDLPNEPESYVHRVGRTGRAGKTGIALSFCSREETSYLRAIERLTRRQLDRLATPEGLQSGVPPEDEPRSAQPARGRQTPRGRQGYGARTSPGRSTGSGHQSDNGRPGDPQRTTGASPEGAGRRHGPATGEPARGRDERPTGPVRGRRTDPPRGRRSRTRAPMV